MSEPGGGAGPRQRTRLAWRWIGRLCSHRALRARCSVQCPPCHSPNSARFGVRARSPHRSSVRSVISCVRVTVAPEPRPIRCRRARASVGTVWEQQHLNSSFRTPLRPGVGRAGCTIPAAARAGRVRTPDFDHRRQRLLLIALSLPKHASVGPPRRPVALRVRPCVRPAAATRVLAELLVASQARRLPTAPAAGRSPRQPVRNASGARPGRLRRRAQGRSA